MTLEEAKQKLEDFYSNNIANHITLDEFLDLVGPIIQGVALKDKHSLCSSEIAKKVMKSFVYTIKEDDAANSRTVEERRYDALCGKTIMGVMERGKSAISLELSNGVSVIIADGVIQTTHENFNIKKPNHESFRRGNPAL
jgi:hypothetical protein